MSLGKLRVGDLISEQKTINEALSIFNHLNDAHLLGASIVYSPQSENLNRTIQLKSEVESAKFKVGILGAGNFTQRTLLPELMALRNPPQLAAIVSAQGASTFYSAQKYNIPLISTNDQTVLESLNIKAVFISDASSFTCDTNYKSIKIWKICMGRKAISFN
jgi:hypothetical protein